MVESFLRRFTVGRRIVGAILILVLLLALSGPLVVINQNFLLGRLQQVTDFEARADRLLLLALARITSSRLNLARYVDDAVPGPYEALADVDQVAELLTEAQGLVTLSEQKQAVSRALEKLTDYKTLIDEVQTTRQTEGVEVSARLVYEAYRVAGDIGEQIEQIVQESEAHVAAANQAVYDEAQGRLVVLISIYVVVLVLALVSSALVQRSITRPVAELRSGAETFRLGQMDTTIPVVGSDELSVLAQTFNQMAAQLSDLYRGLEQQVSERTVDLEQRTAELEELTGNLERVVDQSRRRALRLEASAQVARAVTSVLDRDALLKRVVDLISDRVGFYHVGVFLLDEVGQNAVLRAASSEAGHQMLVRGHHLQVGGQSIVGYVSATGRPRIALDVGKDAVFFDNPDLPQTRSEMALPLTARRRILGVLDIQSLEPEAFDQEDVAVLQTLADQIATALDNARLFEEAQDALREMQAVQSQYAAQAWWDLQAEEGVRTVEYTRPGVVSLGDRPLPAAIRAARDGETVVTSGDGAGHVPASLVVPLKQHGQTIGVLGFQETEPGRVWTTDEIALVEAAAAELVQVLESVRLFQDTQRRAWREQTISQITAQIRANTDMQDIVRTTAEELGRTLGVSRAIVRLGMGEGNRLVDQERDATLVPRAGEEV